MTAWVGPARNRTPVDPIAALGSDADRLIRWTGDLNIELVPHLEWVPRTGQINDFHARGLRGRRRDGDGG